MKLTKRVVDQADHGQIVCELDKRLLAQGKKPGKPDRDVLLWDEPLPGFGLRITSTGVKSYLVQYRDAERATRRVTIGRHGVLTTEAVRAEAQQLLAAVARGENPAERKAEARQRAAEEPTIEDLTARYLKEWAEVRKKPKSVADDEQKIDAYIKKHWKGRTVASITREDMTRLQHKMKDKPIQANRTVALVSKMMNLAEVWGWRPDGSNPCRHVARYKENKRERYLSERELARLGEALREQDKSEYWAALFAIRLLLLTGARLGEILSLRWEYVDFERCLLQLPDSKTGAKVIVLGPPAIKLLSEAQRRKGGPWVCPGERGPEHIVDLNGPWRRLKAKVNEMQDKEEEAGALEKKDRVDLSTLRIHELRHSFASVGAAGGLSLPTIGALLGHTQPATTARYAHLANDPLRQAAASVAGHIAAVLEGEPAGEVLPMDREAGEA